MAKPTPTALLEDIEALQADYEGWQAAADEGEDEEPDLDALKRLLARGKKLRRKSRKLEGGRGREVAGQIEALLSDLRMSEDALTARDDEGADRGEEDAFEELTERLLEGEDVDLDAFAEQLAGEITGSGSGSGSDPSERAREDALIGTLGRRAAFLLARYNRHFGGRPRTSRDLALLEDLHQQLTGLMERLGELMFASLDEDVMERLEMLAEQAELWASESEAIDAERSALRGRPWAEALGAVAREQLTQWEFQVAGCPPLTVRPKLAARLIGTLEYVRSGLGKLAAHALSEDPELPGELAQLDEIIARWRATRDAIKAARKAHGRAQRQQALELAAGDLTLRWASEVQALPDDQRDRALVGGLCDRMYELERQLTNLDEGDEAHERLLNFVRDQLHGWELTWEALGQSAAPQSTA